MFGTKGLTEYIYNIQLPLGFSLYKNVFLLNYSKLVCSTQETYLNK